jgi:hypothetical protein
MTTSMRIAILREVRVTPTRKRVTLLHTVIDMSEAFHA